MSPDITGRVIEEIERLLKAQFIRPIRYTEWLSKSPRAKERCIDFKPKEEYPMPIENGTAGLK